jgi:hypothetical protein
MFCITVMIQRSWLEFRVDAARRLAKISGSEHAQRGHILDRRENKAEESRTPKPILR